MSMLMSSWSSRAALRSAGCLLLVVVLRVGVDDAADELVAYDVSRLELGEVDVLDVVEDVGEDPQPARRPRRQVDLRDVSGDDDLRAEPQPGEEHLHLLGR